ncbi:MAG: hypothetical protein LBJ02_00980, partial [Bifidobacteriaceae bacterium]|nr:hypothetical protein [Bifidobacteriaceae bacterium]
MAQLTAWAVVLPLWLVPSVALAAGMTEVYVSQSGSDAGQGTQAEPFKSLAHAFDEVADGGTVFVMNDLDLEAEAHVGGSGDERSITLAKDPGAQGDVRIVRHDGLSPEANFTGNMLSVGLKGSLTLQSGVVIDGNSVDGSLSAVLVYGTFVMEGGQITGNRSSGYGGGLYLQDTGGALFQMKGGSITGNTATGGGAAVYFLSGTMEVEGDVQLGSSADDNGVYLSGNSVITIAGGLAATARVNLENTQSPKVGAEVATKAAAAGPLTAQDVATFHWQTIAYQVAAGAGDQANSCILAVDQTDFYVAGEGADATGDGSLTKPFATLTRAFEELPKGVGAAVTVHVKSDITELAPAALREGTVTVQTWDQASQPAVISRGTETSFTENLVRVDAGANLTLDGVVLDGSKVANSMSALRVENDSTATLRGAVIRDNYTSLQGGGASVVTGGTLAVEDGSQIAGNQASISGGAVYLYGASSNKASVMTVAGGVVIGTSTGTEGVYLGQDNVVEVLGDLPDSALVAFEGKIGAQVGSVLAHKQGGTAVSAQEARRIYYLYEDFSVAANTDDNTYVLAEGWQQIFVSASGSDSTGLGTRYRPFATLAYTFTQVKEGVPASVVVMDNLTLAQGAVLTGNRTARIRKEVDADAAPVVQRAAGFTGAMVTVNTRATLTIGEVVLDGNSAVTGAAVVSVQGTAANQTAQVTLDGGVIQNGRSTAAGQSAVSVTATVAGAKAEFVLTDGQITGNRAAQGGGVYVIGTATGSSATFNMTGGEISGNTATNQGGGVYMSGALAAAAFSGGVVTSNTATAGKAVYQSASTNRITISGEPRLGTALADGGVYLAGTAQLVQKGDLGPDAWVNIENRAGAAVGTVIATKQNGTVSAAEEVAYHWQANPLERIAAKTADNTYVVDGLIDIYVSSGGSDSTGDGTQQNPFQTLARAFTVASVTAQATVKVMDDLTVSTEASATDGKDIVLRTDPDNGSPAVVKRGALNIYLVSVVAGGSLTLEDLTVDGDKVNFTANTSPLIYVNGAVAGKPARFVLGEGGTLRNNRATTGGALRVYATGANCSATASLDGGQISGNTAADIGGGVFVSAMAQGAAALTASGAQITGNTATDGGGIFGYANGAGSGASSTAQLTLSGGTVGQNAATARGGGIWLEGSTYGQVNLDITGGSISQNTATRDGGGGLGVYASTRGQATATMSGGTIEQNSVSTTAGYLTAGGGVLVYATYASTSSYGTANFNLTGGAVSGNRALNGGGVYLYTANNNTYPLAQATLTGGMVTGNTLTAPAGRGAAVGFGGSSPARQVLRVGGSVQIGTSTADNGVYLPAATYNINQTGNFTSDQAQVNIEGKLGADYNTQVVAKTGANVTAEEAEQYLWQPGNGLQVTALAPSSYVLTGAPEFYVSFAVGDDADGLGNRDRPFKTLARAFTAASTAVQTTVYVMDRVEVEATATVTSGKDIKLAQDPQAAAGTVRVVRAANAIPLLQVNAGGTLTLVNVTVDGDKTNFFANTGPLVYVLGTSNNVNAQFNMQGGSLVDNHGSNGGAISVYTPGGSSAATASRATAAVSGGVVSGNEATLGGAIYVRGFSRYSYAQATVSGSAVLSGNTASTAGGAVAVYGQISGSYGSTTAFSLTGGTITGNSAPTGGGVYLYTDSNATAIAQASLAGGTITGNTLTGAGGHGAAVGFQGAYPVTQVLQVGSGVQIGTDPSDNGVWLPSGYTIKQSGDLTAGARVVVEGKDGAAAGTVLVDKTSGTVNAGEAVQYVWAPTTQMAVVPAASGAQYVLSGVSSLYVSPDGDDSAGDGSRERPLATLTQAFALAATSTAVIVYVMNDLDAPSLATVTSGKSITVRADPLSANPAPRVTRAAGVATRNLIQINSGGSLTWQDAILDGNKAAAIEGSEALVYVVNATANTTASLTLVSGALTNNSAGDGGAVYLRSSAANVRAVMTVSGGQISGNSAVNGAGVYLNGAGASLAMTGGTMTGNEASINGGGLYVTATAAASLAGVTWSGNSAALGAAAYIEGGPLAVSGSVQIGVSDTDNGVYLGAGAVISQAGDLPAQARINVEGRADLATNVLIANKTGGAPVSGLEADQYHWQGGSMPVVPSGTTQYVLQRPVSPLFVAASGSDQTGDGTQANPFASIAHAFAMAPTGTTQVYLLSDVTAAAAAPVTANKTITLAPYPAENEFTVTRGDDGFALAQVSGGGSLILDEVVFDGNKTAFPANTVSLVNVQNTTTATPAQFTMLSGGLI